MHLLVCLLGWPKSKNDRESWEIERFIKHFSRHLPGANLQIIENREKPDFVVGCSNNNQNFGVELTSVYLSDRSVPDEHIPTQSGNREIPYSSSEIDSYKKRVLEAILDKEKKAVVGYSRDNPLVLSVYINEYCSIHIPHDEWSAFFVGQTFDIGNSIFEAVVLWPLVDDEEFILSRRDA